MNRGNIASALLTMLEHSRHQMISPIRGIVLRGGGFSIHPPADFEAGDIIIVPPSLVTHDAPTVSYVHGCIEKCWPQIKEILL